LNDDFVAPLYRNGAKTQGKFVSDSAPDSFGPEVEAMRETETHAKPVKGQRYGFALAFAVMKIDLIKAVKDIKPFINDDTVLWFAYPKQTSKVFKSDLNRDLCWAALSSFSLQPVRQVAIDEDWSALRFKPAP
jgi:hypothetical protein